MLVLFVFNDAQVSNVKLSKRLASTPAVVVASKWGQSAHMEKIMKASVSDCSDKCIHLLDV